MALQTIVWENRAHSGSIGRVGSEVVAQVHYLQTHTLTNSDVYSVDVRGETLPRRFSYTHEAKVAAEREWAEGKGHG